MKDCFHRASMRAFEGDLRHPPFFCSSHVHGNGVQPVYEHHAFRVDARERCTFLHVTQHRRVVDAEPTILCATLPTVGEHVQERVLVDGVVTFAQSFGDVLVDGTETIVRLAAQPDESVAGPLQLEQTRCPLVVPFARDAARLGAGPRATGESTAHVPGRVVGTFFGREPFGAVPEVMFTQFRGIEIIERLGAICVHLAVFE